MFDVCIRCPLTRTGEGHNKGGDDLLQFDHDSSKSFDLYGYTEYIEFEFEFPVFVREIEIGYPRGLSLFLHLFGLNLMFCWIGKYFFLSKEWGVLLEFMVGIQRTDGLLCGKVKLILGSNRNTNS